MGFSAFAGNILVKCISAYSRHVRGHIGRSTRCLPMAPHGPTPGFVFDSNIYQVLLYLHAFVPEWAPQKKWTCKKQKQKSGKVKLAFTIILRSSKDHIRASLDVLSFCLQNSNERISVLSLPLFGRQWDYEHCQMSRTDPEPAKPCLEVKTKKRAVHYLALAQLSLSIGFQSELAVKKWDQMSAVEKEWMSESKVLFTSCWKCWVLCSMLTDHSSFCLLFALHNLLSFTIALPLFSSVRHSDTQKNEYKELTHPHSDGS